MQVSQSHAVMHDKTTFSHSQTMMYIETPSIVMFVVEANGGCAMKFYYIWAKALEIHLKQSKAIH